MPTRAREVRDDAVVHIIQRGNNRQKIFNAAPDYAKFLSVLRDYKEWYRFELYHYCLMSNHLHLLLKIFKKEELSRLMQGVFQSYRFHYKTRYGYTGYLYQGRFKSKLVEDDSYLLECGRYIERNPVRAGVVSDPATYRWSSYHVYSRGVKNDIITEDPLYKGFGSKDLVRRLAYREFVAKPRPYDKLIDKHFRIA